MSSMSQRIELYLKELLGQTPDGIIEVQRNQLAEVFDCVPSQINYVLGTRFTPVQGYFVETRRGFGGFTRIVAVDFREKKDLQSILEEIIGNSLNSKQLEDLILILENEEIITRREALLIANLASDNVLSDSLVKDKSLLRAKILESLILTLIREN